MSLLCSVVIPTHNRSDCLQKMLKALSRQTLAKGQFEVIVVMDGCTDNSEELLKQTQTDFHLEYVLQQQAGQARARNVGVQLAHADVIVFLDDDVIPEPECLEHHLRNHSAGNSIAVLGQAHIALPLHPSLYQKVVWAWWEDRYHEMQQPGRIVSYRDFCVGNASLLKNDFISVGGFDESFAGYGGEDFDLGYRLLKKGVVFHFEDKAVAWHYHETSPYQVLKNMYQEGMHDVILATKYPEIRRGLRLMQHTQAIDFLMQKPLLAKGLIIGLKPFLFIYEALGFRRLWRNLFGKLRHCSYWQGVYQQLGSFKAYQQFCEAAPPIPVIQLDLTHGFSTEAISIHGDGPNRIDVWFQGKQITSVTLNGPMDVPVNTAVLELLLEQNLQLLYQLLVSRQENV